MTSNRPVSEMVERLDSLMIDYPRGEYARGWNCGIAEAAALVRAASSQAPSDDVVERVGEIRDLLVAAYRTGAKDAHDFLAKLPDDERQMVLRDDRPDLTEAAHSYADAALQAVPASGGVGWQLIESAPKDGSYIIAAKFGRSQLAWVKHSRWITAGEIADLEGGEPDEYDPGWTDGNDDSEPCFPTHWMPLGPPALKGSEEE